MKCDACSTDAPVVKTGDDEDTLYLCKTCLLKAKGEIDKALSEIETTKRLKGVGDESSNNNSVLNGGLK